MQGPILLLGILGAFHWEEKESWWEAEVSLGLLGDSCFYISFIELLPFPAPVSGAIFFHKCSPLRTRCAKLLLTRKCENTDYESGKVGIVVTVRGSPAVLQQPQTAAKEEKAQVHIYLFQH